MSEQTIRTIGLLDRALSELKLLALSDIDAADIQTVKHHAEDCVGLGNRVLQILAAKAASSDILNASKTGANNGD